MRFETIATVDAPVDVVWRVMTDVESWPRITDSMTAVELAEGGPLRAGARAKVKQPKLAATEWTVTEYSDNHRFTWASTSLGIRNTAVHEVTTRDGATTVRLELDQAGLLAAPVGLLAGGLIRRYMDMEAQGIKKRAEELA